jgi:two-component system LytT family response regulator
MNRAPALRTLVVEDEREARLNLRDYLRGVDWIEIVGEAADGREAVRLVDRLRPDLLFLDVRLPEFDGLSVLRSIAHTPEVIFTTAYDQHAVAAFELGALDYLVKPFGRERFLQTLERLRRRLAPDGSIPPPGERARLALEPPLSRLFARQGDRIVPIATGDIRRAEACGDYARIHTAHGAYLLHVSLRELEERLDGARFLRLHRSHLVNVESIVHLRRFDERRLAALLTDGVQIVASRAASERLRREAR